MRLFRGVLQRNPESNYSYQVEYKSAMTDSNSTPLGTPFAGTGNPMTFTNTVGGPMGFFRLNIAP